jgi:hypothetical protein
MKGFGVNYHHLLQSLNWRTVLLPILIGDAMISSRGIIKISHPLSEVESRFFHAMVLQYNRDDITGNKNIGDT